MLFKALSTSEKFAALGEVAGPLGEFCQMLYTLLIPHSDDFGRLQGDPFTVKYTCHPSSPRSIAEFATGLQALQEVGLIAWYAVEGKRYVQITQFETHQPGLHRRTRSAFPEFLGSSGNFPESQESPGISEKFPLNRTELNRTEEEKDRARARASLSPTASSTLTSTTDPFLDDAITERAGIFVRKYREVLYPQYRAGAKYCGLERRDYDAAVKLCETWDDSRLEKLAICFLTTNHKWAAEGSRTLPQMRAIASWLDGQLSQWEAEQHVST